MLQKKIQLIQQMFSGLTDNSLPVWKPNNHAVFFTEFFDGVPFFDDLQAISTIK